MLLLGLTEFSGFIGLLALVVAAAILTFAACSRASAEGDTIRAPAWQVVAIFALEAVGLFFWLLLITGLVGWLYIFGDNEPGPVARLLMFVIPTGVAILVPGAIAGRVLLSGAAAGELRIHLAAGSILMGLFLLMYGYESLQNIDGLTPYVAARTALADFSKCVDGPVSMREGPRPPPGDWVREAREFSVHGRKNELLGRFVIVRHPWLGWSMAGREVYDSSAKDLRLAKEYLSYRHNQGAVQLLQKIVKTYPDTTEATEARKLLDTIPQR